MTNVNLLNWNLEWALQGSPRGKIISETIEKAAADIICLTETHASFPAWGGHAIFAEPDYGYPVQSDRRKVALWSKEPWRDVNSVGHEKLPSGRFVSGKTNTPVGEVAVIGVCIPWQNAHVSTGQRNKRPWEDHLAYVALLATILARVDEPAILMGDFNQTLPRTRSPVAVWNALSQSLAPRFTVATSGVTDGVGKSCIDHICHTESLRIEQVCVVPSISETGLRLSDHFGVRVSVHRTDM